MGGLTFQSQRRHQNNRSSNQKVVLDLTPPRLRKIHLQLKRVTQARNMELVVRGRHRVQHDNKRLGNILPRLLPGHAYEVVIKESIRTRVWVQVESVHVVHHVEELFFPYSPYSSERQSEKERGRLKEHVLISSHSSNHFLLPNKRTLLERLHLGEECLAIPISAESGSNRTRRLALRPNNPLFLDVQPLRSRSRLYEVGTEQTAKLNDDAKDDDGVEDEDELEDGHFFPPW